MNRALSTLCVVTAGLVALGGISFPQRESPAASTFTPDPLGRYTAKIAELEAEVGMLQIEKLEVEQQLASVLSPAIKTTPSVRLAQNDPIIRYTQPSPVPLANDPPLVYVRGGCASGSCSVGSGGYARGPVRAVGRRLGWRLTHPFGGRLRRR